MKALTDYMKREDISQAELAKRLRVTPVQVNRWVREQRSPNLENRKYMAKRLGIPLAELL